MQQQFGQLIKDYPGIWKTISQGAATYCWASTTPDLRGKTGLYLEGRHVAEPTTGDPLQGGHSDYAYDKMSAKKLWDISIEVLGTQF
ncbi:hypothetical protein [Ruegeria sp. SCP11]|uniref:hypothetical protein n=1 Tax=Ruegeria sp. SCP11 TaxID=3141378 RepID=UPI0033369D51